MAKIHRRFRLVLPFTALVSLIAVAVPAQQSVSGADPNLLLDCNVSPSSLVFEATSPTYQDQRQFTINNTGTANLSGSISVSDNAFVVNPATYDIAPGGSQVVDVTFTADGCGGSAGVIDVGAGCGTVSVQGFAENIYVISLPSSLEFSAPTIGSSDAQTLMISNSGCGAMGFTLMVSGPGGPAPEFSVSPGYVVVGPGETTVDVTYTPADLGDDTCTITLNPDFSAGYFVTASSVPCAGSGPSECNVSPSSLVFEAASPSYQDLQQFTITNSGAANLSGMISVSDNAFAVDPETYDIAPGSSQVVDVTFTADGCGGSEGVIDVGAGCGTVAVQGIAEDIYVISLPSSLEFRAMTPGSSDTQTMVINNSGCGAMGFTVMISGPGGGAAPEFSVDPGYVVVGPGDTTVDVTYTPTNPGDDSCRITLNPDFATGYFVTSGSVPCIATGPLFGVDYLGSTATVVAGEPISVFSWPDGSRDPLSNAFGAGGERVDGTIILTLIDTLGEPIAGFPEGRIRLISTGLSPDPCCDVILHPDGPTDANGRTTFSGALHMGGHSLAGDVMRVVVDDVALYGTDLDIRFNSPDITGDCKVDLNDIPPFATDFYAPATAYRSDFNFNGEVDLSDLVLLAPALGSNCALVKAASGSPDGQVLATSLAFRGDPHGTVTALAATPGQPFTIYMVIAGAGRADLLGWECRTVASPNLRLLGWELAGKALNVGSAPDFWVGLADPLPVDGTAVLATARCLVTDGQPAWLDLTHAPVSSFHPARPAILVQSSAKNGSLRPVKTGGRLMINGGTEGASVSDRNGGAALWPAAPNPLNPQTTIAYVATSGAQTRLAIYDVAGRLIRTLVDETASTSGRREVVWDGRDDSGRLAAAGVYFYRLESGGFSETKRMVLVK